MNEETDKKKIEEVKKFLKTITPKLWRHDETKLLFAQFHTQLNLAYFKDNKMNKETYETCNSLFMKKLAKLLDMAVACEASEN